MSNPVTGAVSWNTPVVINSGDVVAAADLTALNKDVAFLRAAPWTFYYQTANGSTVASGSNQTLFGGSGAGAYTTVASTSAVGSFNNTSGVITVPLTGLYQITLTIACAGLASGTHWRPQITGLNSGSTVWTLPGPILHTAGTGWNDFVTHTVTVPMGAGAQLGSSAATSFSMQVLNVSGASAITPQGAALPGLLTYASITYLGISTGAY